MRIRSSGAVRAALAFVLVSCAEGGVAPVGVDPGIAATPTVAPAFSVLPSVRISEFHYDNTGIDAGEAIEISGPAGTSLAGWQLVLYNGSNGAPYDTKHLSGTIPATCGARGVVVVEYPSNGIQNGSPDGMALVSPTNEIEFLSYEGAFTAVGGPADGMVSTDIGVIQNGTEQVGSSLHRNSAGVWSATQPLGTNTFGACNDSDGPPPATIESVTITPENATIFQNATQQFTAAAFDADGNPVAGAAFTWTATSNTPGVTVASVSAAGLAAGLEPGDATITVTASGKSASATLHVDEAPPPPPDAAVRIVEIHYDNAGTDAGEAIEIKGPAGTSLAGWSIVLYNGNGGAPYNTRNLTGTIPATCGTEGVVAVTYPSNGIQNGSPDGMALVSPSGVVEFLSYEGTFTAVGGPANGIVSTDIGVDQPDNTPAGRSLQKDPDGVWYGPATSSFGACNPPAPPPAPSISFTGRQASAAPLPVGFEDQLFATLRDGATGQTIQTTWTWAAETPSIATIDQQGVMRALAAGSATFRATAADGTTATFTLPMAVATPSTTAQYANNAEFGEPADADPSDDFIVRRLYFTSSWNGNRGIPNWVSYNLEATHIVSGQDRCDCFTFDPELPASFPPYTTADYTGAGAAAGYGIDRGHLARSFDRTAGSLDNATTYYFTNIIPQAADNNQGPWAAMETYLGDLARFQNREVYIIAGVAGSKGTVKDEGKIVIPASTWKVAVIMDRDQGLQHVNSYTDVEVIAVIMPNDPGIRNVNWETYKTTVDAVEALSGYDVLALLPDHIERVVESGIPAALALLNQLAANGTISGDDGDSFLEKLNAALNQIARGNSTAAVNQLGSFRNQIDAMVRSGRLTAADANTLRQAAALVIQSLSP